LLIDEIKKESITTLYTNWQSCFEEPSNSSLQSARDLLNRLYGEVWTIRRVIIGDLKHLYGEWGDEEPDEDTAFIWKRLNKQSLPTIEEPYVRNLSRLRCLEWNLRDIGSTISSAQNIQDLVFNRSKRKYYLDQAQSNFLRV